MQYYMHIETGEVDTAEGWVYTDEDGNSRDPVAEGCPNLVEVFQVCGGDWVEL